MCSGFGGPAAASPFLAASPCCRPDVQRQDLAERELRHSPGGYGEEAGTSALAGPSRSTLADMLPGCVAT